MGVPIDGTANIFGDNTSIVNGKSISESKFSKKQLGICYHTIREASADVVWKVGSVKGTHNVDNFLTKILSGIHKEREVDKWMWRK